MKKTFILSLVCQRSVSFLIAVLALAGCSKMDATYVDFIRDGKIVYPGRVDSALARGGRNRIALSWLLIDPNVTKTSIYWNSRSDSIEVPVERTSGVDTLQVMLHDMQEGPYAFEFYTYDDEGNKSIKVEVSGQVYGTSYIGSLLPRPVRSVTPGLDTALVYWGEPTDDAVGTELEYTGPLGETHRLFVPAGEEETLLPGLEWGGWFRYRTVFLPDSAAIDTFYTDYDTIATIEPGQDFALGKPVTGSSDCSCGPLESITDGDYETYWQPQGSDRDDLNLWVNIDLGARHKLNGAHIYWSASEGEEDQIASYQLLVSDDEENWEPAFEKTSGVSMEEEVTFPEVNGRYLRLDVTSATRILLRTHAVELYYNQ